MQALISHNKQESFCNKRWGLAICLTPTFMIEPNFTPAGTAVPAGAALFDFSMLFLL